MDAVADIQLTQNEFTKELERKEKVEGGVDVGQQGREWVEFRRVMGQLLVWRQ